MSTHHGILIHVVFSTKLRFPCLHERWRDDLFAYMGGIARDHEAIILCAGGVEDHVHMLMKMSPKYAISKTIQLIKANSSRWVNDRERIGGKFAWQRGFGAFSVSQSSVEKVKAYIRNQPKHHQTQNFEAEYLEFLRRHRIDFDPRYVFEQEIVG